MALTIASKISQLTGNKRQTQATITLDSSYAYGGESLTPGNMGLRKIDRLDVMPVSGYSFEYDKTNEKLKVYSHQNVPPIVHDEQHTIASNAITLNYPAAAILQIATAGQSQMLIEPSDTMAANECQLSAAMTDGVSPTINFEASTSGAVKVTYITQAWREVWENRTASADFATASHVADMLDTVCFIESMLTLDTAGDPVTSLSKFVRGGDAADAGECEVDWSDAGAGTAGDTTLTFAAGDAVTDIKITYISLPASGFLKERFLEDEDLTIASNVGASKYPILFQSLCNQIPDYTAAGERPPHHLMMPEGDALGTAQEARIDWHLTATLAGNQVGVNDASSDAVSLTYVYGYPAEIPSDLRLECTSGTDLSSVAVIVNAVGE